MSAPRIVVIHTSPATLDVFGRLLRDRLPGVRLSNLLDDSILPELRANGGDLKAVAPRWNGYARTARALGAELVLNACSSIGELCAPMALELCIPVVRVDAAMAREAISRGKRIAVVATLQSTLRPTRDLLAQTAQEAGRVCAVDATLVEGAYEALIGGDQEEHDRRVAQALAKACAGADAVVLAQASMARVLPRLESNAGARCLVSPPYAVEAVAAALAA